MKNMLIVLMIFGVLSGCTSIPIHEMSIEYKAPKKVNLESPSTGQVVIIRNLRFLPELEGERASGSTVMGQMINGDALAQLSYALFDITESVEKNKYLGYLPNSRYLGSPLMAVSSNVQYRAYKLKADLEDKKRFYTAPGLLLTLPAGKRKIAYLHTQVKSPKPSFTSFGLRSDAIEIDVKPGKTSYVFLQRRMGFMMNRELITLKGIGDEDIQICNSLVADVLNEENEIKGNKDYHEKIFAIADKKGYNSASWKQFCYLISGFAASEIVEETQPWLDENKAVIIKRLNKRVERGVKAKPVDISRKVIN